MQANQLQVCMDMTAQGAIKKISNSSDVIWDEVLSFESVQFQRVGRYLQRRACGYVFFSSDGSTARLDDLANAMARSCYFMLDVCVDERPLDSQVRPIRVLWPFIDALAQSTPEQRQRILLERAVRTAQPAQKRLRKI
ncbi:TPA: hypothetical protein ACG4NT_000056 [Stenotrophomonas maltophilia]|uniref:hypothetical protein n=1 Tax=Stenotrophomonas maltophilia TaxID=40324 RepID=UPI000B4C5EA3|nr:hypothetical protein [Stenotrophomonas maltophilia]OWQ71319.1 hypothetical protein CEE57_10535 [Stenotrophomonas maltophilia]HDS1367019.1 hypothetical protein [Stenotrophomonas maltophilia]HDS1371823.1 hypothetical protein [Stenotrophomonas maltophilia]HDS1376419.1 hypothetical protein [Stenotrophomonas maltophilia]HDS1381273.1 hypothetical protein [Stenotrophomonas maltophilia]